jgi:hypothetical protein
MEDTIRLYRTLLGNRAYLRSLAEGAAFLAASTIAIFAAVTYATVHASNYVTDFVLSRVGPFNVRFLFIYGTFTAFVITASLLAWRPNRVPFALKAMALFLLVRAVFVALTHMAPSPIDPQKPAPFFNSIFAAAIYSSPATPACRFSPRLPSGISRNGERSISR